MTDLSDSRSGNLGPSRGACDNKNGRVLVTNTSELVDILINEKDDTKFLITIDSENLLRSWSVKSGTTTFSYKLPMK